MRRAWALLAIPAVLALAGFDHAPRAESSIAASVSCNNMGSGSFACYASASGGSGGYTYTWSWYQKRLGHTIGGPFPAPSPDPEAFGTCSLGYTVYVTVTVADSQGATTAASTQLLCRQWPD
ncbi:SprB repeat-containing protein [Longimicrobium sp.]|uniref:SprB repeat-containing protein n=1 Tax=Longimicrobium sp. TaxID=2029185 RepID=UPI002E2F7DE2|nr:SprB repeat-containing protein [Longimicrobium sp.]HEX6042220.1 SprB repeat-containing protein [Longimicrobium sp.]